MSRQKSPQELYPNLFAAKPVSRLPARPKRPEEMRLLKWMMRQASRRISAIARPSVAEARRAAPAARPAPRPLNARPAR